MIETESPPFHMPAVTARPFVADTPSNERAAAFGMATSGDLMPSPYQTPIAYARRSGASVEMELTYGLRAVAIITPVGAAVKPF